MFLFYLYIKNLIVSPLFICLVFLSIGLFFLWTKKKQKIGKIILTMGVFLLLLFSFPFFPNLLLGRLESKYDMFTCDKNEVTNLNLKYVVVLGGGAVPDPKVPITGQFVYPGLVRLIEGIRLYREMAGAKLILSGGPGFGLILEADIMAELSISLGVKSRDIILETKSLNTYEQAKFIRNIVGESKFLLVTSASHMPRAVGLFKKCGMNPLPAPTGHLIIGYRRSFFPYLIPSLSNLYSTEALFYEYLGLIKEKLINRI